jgi:hypothetical protein
MIAKSFVAIVGDFYEISELESLPEASHDHRSQHDAH